ncbi:MAG TPA: lysylphosphatidylglycerol synthase transmembrane domain-containing protein [Bryobacteraceae bacterium]|nr:lysylphosphatidylglycerol synthase transmembrane domain-containing protein [Bryobacteraceae bacterium]
MSTLSSLQRRRAALVTLAVLIILGILALRSSGVSFNWNLFLGTIQGVSWIWLIVAILLMLLTYVGRALRWEVMLQPLGRKVSISRLTSDTAIGYMAATLLGRVGELVRPYLISVSAGVSFSSQIAAWLLERVLDLLAVLLIFGFALLRVPSHGLPLGAGLRWTLHAGGYLAAVAGFVCLLVIVAFRNFSQTARERILAGLSFLPSNYYSRSKTVLNAFARGVEVTQRPGPLSLLAVYTGLEWVLITAAYAALLKCFVATRFLKITDVVTLLGFIAFGSIVQIPGIGGGIQITSIVVLREIYGLSLESASGIALFIWILTLIVVVPLGLACALHQGMNWHKIKQLANRKLPEEEELT